MRIVHIDIDSLRPDHLGCYGYHRNTSPTIDRLANEGARFEHVYTSDAPCLPSRTAMWSGRFGIHTGVVGHGGTAATPFIEGPSRGFVDQFARTGWMACLRQAGLHTATISSFGERHAAWHWHAGFNEIINTGRAGMDTADEVVDEALGWLDRRSDVDNWYLHLNLWDPHTPYRAPPSVGNPFRDEPLPAWLTEDVWRACWNGYGPHSPQEPHDFRDEARLHAPYPWVPAQIDGMDAVRRWIDGYDTGIRYADEQIGRLLDDLDRRGLLHGTAIMVTADHGENLGELNVWGDHQTADVMTCRVPLIVRWPDGPRGHVDRGYHYLVDWAATTAELLGRDVPENWDGQSFADAFTRGEESGREFLVSGQGAWACQRGVRFHRDGTEWLCLQTHHDGYKMLEPMMLFDLNGDPHEQANRADDRPEVADRGLALLAQWQREMARTSPSDIDPLWTVLREGGPFHTRGKLPDYLERLRATGRGIHAETLAERHPAEAEGDAPQWITP